MMTTEDVILRILAALILGGIIGLERQYHDKPAGFATNTLICAGSAVFTLLSIASAFNYGGDPARIAAQIVAGVGFLGAGSILREGNKISGLTTAAGIWIVAAVGMAAGYGEFVIAGTATIFVLILQLFLRKLMNSFDYVRLYDSLTIKCEPSPDVVEKINDTLKKHNAEIIKEDLFKEDGMFIVKMIINMSKKAFTESFKELILIKEIKSLDK